MKYRIGVKEIWEQMYEVEASSEEEAVMKTEAYLMSADDEDVTLLEEELAIDYVLDKDDWAVYTDTE